MKLKTYKKCGECNSCINMPDGHFYCNMKMLDPKNNEMDVSVCEVDRDTKPADCPWDNVSRSIEELSTEDQTGIRCMAKMFGGETSKDWFEYKQTNKEWLSSLPAEQFYDEFKKAEKHLRFSTDTRLAVIEWLDKVHE